jgi:hypothetical protein
VIVADRTGQIRDNPGIGPLPKGDLEIVALCNGFVSTNGPGQFQMRYPQRHSLGTNNLAITVGKRPSH